MARHEQVALAEGDRIPVPPTSTVELERLASEPGGSWRDGEVRPTRAKKASTSTLTHAKGSVSMASSPECSKDEAQEKLAPSSCVRASSRLERVIRVLAPRATYTWVHVVNMTGLTGRIQSNLAGSRPQKDFVYEPRQMWPGMVIRPEQPAPSGPIDGPERCHRGRRNPLTRHHLGDVLE